MHRQQFRGAWTQKIFSDRALPRCPRTQIIFPRLPHELKTKKNNYLKAWSRSDRKRTIYVFIRRIYGNIRRFSVYSPYSCRIFLGNFKPQLFWSWLEPEIVKEVTDGVEGLVCNLKCMKGRGGCGKLLGIVNPSRSAKEHATERRVQGAYVYTVFENMYMRYLKTWHTDLANPRYLFWQPCCDNLDKLFGLL